MAGPSVELLQRVPLFVELEPRELERLSGSFKERTFSPGESVAAEGEGAAGFFVIESDARIAWPLLQAMAKRLRAAEAEAGS